VHFTFADGALGYDCVRCGSRCCHGLGFALRQDELIPFLGKAPRLAPFLQLRDHGADAFDLADGCWLLGQDGRCSLEVTEGRGAKPSVCRLFPLYARLIGRELVVDLRMLFCPLEDASTLPASAAVLRHAEAAAEIEALARPFAKETAVAPGAPEDLLQREAAVRDAAYALAVSDSPATVIAHSHGFDQGVLSSLYQSWRRFFGSGTKTAAQVARPLALAVPLLRMAALTAPGAAPWPRLSRTLPASLLAAAFYIDLSVQAGRPASLRGFAEVWRSTASVRELLARWSEPRRVPEGPPPAGPPELARAFQQVQASTRPIGEALEATSLAPPLRPLLVRALADRLM
jgi:hypothetical protein